MKFKVIFSLYFLYGRSYLMVLIDISLDSKIRFYQKKFKNIKNNYFCYYFLFNFKIFII